MNKQNALELVARLQAAIESSAWPAAVDGLPSACACPHDGGAAPALDDTSAPQMLQRLAAAAMLPLPDEAGAERQHVGTALAQAAAALGAGAETLRDLGAGADPAQARLAENLAADLERAALVFQQAAAWGWNEGDAALGFDRRPRGRSRAARRRSADGRCARAAWQRLGARARECDVVARRRLVRPSGRPCGQTGRAQGRRAVPCAMQRCRCFDVVALVGLRAVRSYGQRAAARVGLHSPMPAPGLHALLPRRLREPGGLHAVGEGTGWVVHLGWLEQHLHVDRARRSQGRVLLLPRRWDRFWAVDDCRCTTTLVRTGQRVARHTWKSATRVAPVAPPPKFIVSTGC